MKIIIRRPRRPILAPPRRPSRPRASPVASRASRARDDARARARDAHLFDRASLFRVSDSTTLEPRRSVRARVDSRVASCTTRSGVDRSKSRASSIGVDARATTCARASGGPAAVDALAKPSFTYYTRNSPVYYTLNSPVYLAKNRDRARSIAPADARSMERRSRSTIDRWRGDRPETSPPRDERAPTIAPCRLYAARIDRASWRSERTSACPRARRAGRRKRACATRPRTTARRRARRREADRSTRRAKEGRGTTTTTGDAGGGDGRARSARTREKARDGGSKSRPSMGGATGARARGRRTRGRGTATRSMRV